MNETFTNVARRRQLPRARRRLLGVAVRRASCSLPRERGASPTSRRSPSSCRRWSTSERSGVMFTVDPATGDATAIVIEARVRPRRGRRRRSGRAGHVRRRQGRAAPARRPRRAQDAQDRARSRRRRPARRRSRRGRRPARAARDDEVLALAPTRRCASRTTTARRRTWSGRSPTGRRFSSSRGRSPRCAPSDRRGCARQAGRCSLRGLGASPGRGQRAGSGPRSSPADGALLVAGEVLVAPMTNPDWVPVLRRPPRSSPTAAG